MMWPSKGTKTMIKNSSEFIKHPRFPDMGCAPSQQSVSSKLLLCSRFETNALLLIPILCTYQGCFVLQTGIIIKEPDLFSAHTNRHQANHQDWSGACLSMRGITLPAACAAGRLPRPLRDTQSLVACLRNTHRRRPYRNAHVHSD